MIQKLRSNQKGFTLIELMIVIAIIGILAAIAVPQFMAYRMRGYHTMAASDCRNWVAAEASLFEDGACYGIPSTTSLNGALGTGMAAVAVGNTIVAGGGSAAEMRAATDTAAGTSVTGSRETSNGAGGWVTLDFAFPVAVGDGVELTAGVSVTAISPAENDSYVIVSEHQKGIRAFAADSDVSSTIFFAEDDTWNKSALRTINAAAPAVTVNADDLTNVQATATGRNANWAPMK